MRLDELTAWIDRQNPRGRDWHMSCQALMYWAVRGLAGGSAEVMHHPSHPSAMAAYRASRIESLDPMAAPAGAIHYFANPSPDGHVGMEVGGGQVLMTGTPAELGAGATMLGVNYGVTTVARFMSRGTQRYLGWSRSNGDNPSVVGNITSAHAQDGEITVHTYRHADHQARNGGRRLAPGARFFLNRHRGEPASKATNLVGAVGQYSITLPVYAEGGQPGESLLLELLFQTTDKHGKVLKNSMHYSKRLTFDTDGLIRDEQHVQPYVGSSEGGVAVYASLTNPKGNTSDARITLFDSTAYLFG